MTEADSTLLPPLGERAVFVYASLVDQLRAFVTGQGFTDVVVGISGGIDSALVAAIAVDALGAAHVHGVSMPSRYTTTESNDDAKHLMRNLGLEWRCIPIGAIMEKYDTFLDASLSTNRTAFQPAGIKPSVKQNLQARVRANILMAFSNQYDWLVLATGNRSEAQVGYTTLYGDMVGAFAPLAPLYKGWVYELARYCNSVVVDAGGSVGPVADAVIPQRILTKAPSAELDWNQTDEDELGAYATLDAVLYYRSLGETCEELQERGFPREEVERIDRLVTRASFKHRFAAPGALLDIAQILQGGVADAHDL